VPRETAEQITVVKASGDRESFSEEKVLDSLKRAGANRELAEDVLKTVEAELYEGISTKEIYQHVFRHLQETGAHLASKYNLKRAIMELGPSGYPFEKFLARVFESEGHQTAVGQQIRGKCVWHEVDVIAEKDGMKKMIEAKFHNENGIKTDTKVALYVWARYLDVSAGDGFDEGWLVTNTKLTRDARIYADCVGLKYMSWSRPAGQSLRELVERSGLYPVTALISLSPQEKATLLGEGIVACKDLPDNLESVPRAKRKAVEEEVRKLISDRQI